MSQTFVYRSEHLSQMTNCFSEVPTWDSQGTSCGKERCPSYESNFKMSCGSLTLRNQSPSDLDHIGSRPNIHKMWPRVLLYAKPTIGHIKPDLTEVITLRWIFHAPAKSLKVARFTQKQWHFPIRLSGLQRVSSRSIKKDFKSMAILG